MVFHTDLGYAGKGESIWACNSYHLYKEDFRMLKELGVIFCWIRLIFWRMSCRILLYNCTYKCFVTVCYLHQLFWWWWKQVTCRKSSHSYVLSLFRFPTYRMYFRLSVFLYIYEHFYTLTLRRLMSYIYGAPILDVSRSHTTTQHSR